MTPFDFRPRTRVVFGAGEFSRLGEIARELGGSRCLVVADPGIVEAGHAQEAIRSLKARRMEVVAFHNFTVNPTAAMIEAGRDRAAPHNIDLIVSIGGGSSMDCAKGINFLVSNGGKIRDYLGYGKASRPMLPMIAIPTTAGTGSEAQSFCIVSDTASGARMACGDPKASFRVAILDPKLTMSQSKELTAATGYDALSHSVETLVTTRHNALSECFSRSAWRLINCAYERVLRNPSDLQARGGMLLGAHFGGLAVENSMLGAAHACASPLQARYRLPHGVAVALMLPHVVRWNQLVAGARYHELYSGDLEQRLRDLAEMAALPLTLREAGVPEEALPRLADEASAQWTGRFNPRPLDAAGALELYRAAL
ncbi:MAG: iron-containing alcohol dehydrogenase [Bryobacterales bacterium]|nr:iron-containing alcohol dehydrogenase [Bryobacterales bacterium]MBV9397298.1 iron-containing alcohol dehydrogenase [Bryobacterales bacterium]